MKKRISLCLIISVLISVLSVNVCAVTDVDLNTRGDLSATQWSKRINLLESEYKNAPAHKQNETSDIVVTKNTDGSVVYGNTNGLYPGAVYLSDRTLTVNSSAALEMDFEVAEDCKASIYVYFGPSDPEDLSEGAYVHVLGPDMFNPSDLTCGHYSGVVVLADLLQSTLQNPSRLNQCFDEDGNLLVTGIKIYVNSGETARDNVVTINKLNLVSMRKNPVIAGDLTDDAAVDINDAIQLFYYINDALLLTEGERSIADMNADGAVTLHDLVTLFYIANGIL